MTAAAGTLGLRLRHMEVHSPQEYPGAFEAAKNDSAGVLLVESPRMVANRRLVAELELKNKLPVMGEFPPTAEAGALMSYGPDLNDLFRRAATYVDKILKGAKPADLPVEQPSKFELVIYMK